MNRKTLYIVRHGETDYNKRRMVQGSGIDASLNKTGIEQASKFYGAYKNYGFEKIYVSSLIRTKQSVESFIDDGIPYEILPGLNEISWGTQEGLPFDEAAHENYLSVTEAWSKGQLNLNVGGGETPIEVMQRQKTAITYIENTEESNILICMHGRAMRVLLCWLLNYPLKNMDYFTHSNLGVYKLNFSGSFYTIQHFNDLRHLK